MLQAESGPQAGMVTLKWTQEGANTINYNVMYGTTPGTDLYGALNIGRANPEIGNQNRYTVKSLTPGVTYYFRLVSIHTDGSNGGPSLYVKATAASGVTAGDILYRSGRQITAYRDAGSRKADRSRSHGRTSGATRQTIMLSTD